MTTPAATPTQIPQPIPPKCPYCGHVLAEVGLFSWISPPWMILNVNCSKAECRSVLHMQIVPVVDQQQEELPTRGPRIVQSS